MKFVEIYKLQGDGTQKVIATCKLIGSDVEVSGEVAFKESLETEGIIDYSSQERKRLLPKDGLAFLQNLKHMFKSGYLEASEILDG